MLRALATLDGRLNLAAESIHLLFGPDSTRDLFRGLHLTPADAARTLARAPVVPLFGPLGIGGPLLSATDVAGTGLERVRDEFGLSPFDLDAVVVLLAPEIDARYERLYAFIQDDVAKKRPTLDLLLNLLCASVPEKLAAVERFEASAPLVRHGLVQFPGATTAPEAPRLSRPLALDPAVVSFLLGHATVDRRIAAFARIWPAIDRVSDEDTVLPRLSAANGRPLTFYLRGPGAREALFAVRGAAGPQGVLAIDCERALLSGAEFETLLRTAVRSVRLAGQVLFVHDIDRLWEVEHRSQLLQLLELLSEAEVPACLSGRGHLRPSGDRGPTLVAIELGARRPGGGPLGQVAESFDMTEAQLERTMQHASWLAHQRGLAAPSEGELIAAARVQTRGGLVGLADRVQVQATWDDLVLPPDRVAQLREIGPRVSGRDTVLRDWDFGRRRYGRGSAVLFAGPSGTGKTFAAAVLANAVGLDMYRVDLSCVISKYIGETEKNLARLFDAAGPCVLLFDEAEALFGKRSEVRDAHDRYANQEVAYLLQRIEQFHGLAVLTTNLPGSMDEAFRRRLAATVYFPFPDEASRRSLWRKAWPAQAPLAPDIDCDLLAREFEVAGGVIAQAALSAAYLASEDGRVITMSHVLHALRRELEALGIPLPRSVTATPASEAR